MKKETAELRRLIGTWRWEWKGKPKVKQEVRLSAQDWDDLRLLAAERCLTPQTVLERWIHKNIEEWRKS